MKKVTICFTFVVLFFISCKKDKNVISNLSTNYTLSDIVYVSDNEEDWNIYTMDIDGKNKRQLTENPGLDFCPKFSPDGKSIVYHSDVNGQGGIWIMQNDKNNKRKLFEISITYSRYFDFTPDGKKILHLSNDGQVLNIINIDGTNHFTVNIRMLLPYRINPYVFSPDGSKIIFSSDQFNPGNFDICLLDLYNNQNERLVLPIDCEYEIGPRFSPDGNSIVYFSEGSNYNIFSYEMLTQYQKKLTPDTSFRPFDPIYTPDGSKIIFTADAGLNIKNKRMDPLEHLSLFIMNTDGSEILQLSEAGGTYSAEVVFSDNENVLFYKRGLEIFRVSLNYLFQEKIIELPYDIDTFIQKGSYIYFKYNSVLYRIKIDGTDLINLTDQNQKCTDFQLSP